MYDLLAECTSTVRAGVETVRIVRDRKIKATGPVRNAHAGAVIMMLS